MSPAEKARSRRCPKYSANLHVNTPQSLPLSCSGMFAGTYEGWGMVLCAAAPMRCDNGAVKWTYVVHPAAEVVFLDAAVRQSLVHHVAPQVHQHVARPALPGFGGLVGLHRACSRVNRITCSES